MIGLSLDIFRPIFDNASLIRLAAILSLFECLDRNHKRLEPS